MEVTKFSDTSVKIKTKLATFAVNPIGLKAKVQADAALLLTKGIKSSDVQVEPGTLVVSGPGEYETKGVKFSGVGKSGTVSYAGKMENMDIFVGKLSTLSQGKDVIQDSQVVFLEADTQTVEQNQIASFNANVLIFYGEFASQIAHSLGKEVVPVAKFAVTRDKLPSELEIVVL